MPGDLFVRYYCVNHDYGVGTTQMYTDGDAVHKVYFRTKDGTLRYGYIQEYIAPNDLNIKDSKRIGSYKFYYYNFDPETNKLKVSDEVGSDVVYTVSREINYRRGGTGTDSGKILGTLPVGTKLKGIGSNCVTYYDHVYFKYFYNE